MSSFLRETLQTLLVALLVFLALQASVRNFRVEGSSMEPTLHPGQYLLVNRLVYARIPLERVARFLPFVEARPGQVLYLFHPPRRGEIIVFRSPRNPRRDLVKRIIGEPGDTVEVRRGRVYVNGSPLSEPYLASRDFRSLPPFRVPPGYYFVMGDNRRRSTDSRDWGPIPLSAIVGKAWFTYWPPSEAKFLSLPFSATIPVGGR